MGFRSPKLYLNPAVNKFFPPSQPFPRIHGHGELNAMAIYLGCRISDGLSPYVNASGDAFFVGTTAQCQPVTSNVLWGAANFVYEAMDYYGDEYVTELERFVIFREWGSAMVEGRGCRMQELGESTFTRRIRSNAGIGMSWITAS